MTRINKSIKETIIYLRTPVFAFKWTHAASQHNSNILDTFNIALGDSMKSQKVTPLGYGSKLWYPTGTANLFKQHENTEKLTIIIKEGY